MKTYLLVLLRKSIPAVFVGAAAFCSVSVASAYSPNDDIDNRSVGFWGEEFRDHDIFFFRGRNGDAWEYCAALAGNDKNYIDKGGDDDAELVYHTINAEYCDYLDNDIFLVQGEIERPRPVFVNATGDVTAAHSIILDEGCRLKGDYKTSDVTAGHTVLLSKDAYMSGHDLTSRIAVLSPGSVLEFRGNMELTGSSDYRYEVPHTYDSGEGARNETKAIDGGLWFSLVTDNSQVSADTLTADCMVRMMNGGQLSVQHDARIKTGEGGRHMFKGTDVEIGGNLRAEGKTLFYNYATLRVGGTATFIGDVEMRDMGQCQLHDLNIDGNFDYTGSPTLEVQGSAVIEKDLKIHDHSQIVVDEDLRVNGTLKVENGSKLMVKGSTEADILVVTNGAIAQLNGTKYNSFSEIELLGGTLQLLDSEGEQPE